MFLLTFPFHLSPLLYQSMIPDFSHQRPDPKPKKSVEAFPLALLGFGLGPSAEEHTPSLDKQATYSWRFMSIYLSLQNPQHSFSKPLGGFSPLFLWVSYPLHHSLSLLGRKKKRLLSRQNWSSGQLCSQP